MRDHTADDAVGILGLGHVGSPLAVAFAEAGSPPVVVWPLAVGSPLAVALAGAGLGATGRVPAYVDVL